MNVTQYKNTQMNIWDLFVCDSFNGTLFHKQRFLSYHIDKKFDDVSLIFKDKKDIVSVFPAACIENSLISHPGASFGGLVLKSNDISLVLDVIDTLIDFAKQKSFDSITMRLPPLVLCKYPTDTTEFCLLYRGFYHTAVELSTYVPLGVTQPEYEVIRKAKKSNEKFVAVRESNDFDQFYEVLCKNLEKHNARPTHSLDELKKLKEMFPKEIVLFGAYLDKRLIAGVMVFINNDVSFETFYISQDYVYTEFYPVNLLIMRIMEWGIYNKFKCMNFGISTEEKGRKINFGLSSFKESFGGLDITRNTFRKDLNDI